MRKKILNNYGDYRTGSRVGQKGYLPYKDSKMKKVEKSEAEVLKAFEDGEWQPLKDVQKKKTEYARYAKNTAAKNKRINIRLSEKDLANLKAKSLEEGIPYQTLIASIIHNYVHGKFREI